MENLTDYEALKKAAELKEAEQREAARERLGVLRDSAKRQQEPHKRLLNKLAERKRTTRPDRNERNSQPLTQPLKDLLKGLEV